MLSTPSQDNLALRATAKSNNSLLFTSKVDLSRVHGNPALNPSTCSRSTRLVMAS